MEPTTGAASDRYRTPEWLDQSFVLPVPRLEPDAGEPAAVLPLVRPPAQPETFVRPAADEVDFVKVVRRSDTCALARRTSTVALFVALLAMITFQLTGTAAFAVVAVATASVAVSASLVRFGLRKAPIPRRH